MQGRFLLHLPQGILQACMCLCMRVYYTLIRKLEMRDMYVYCEHVLASEHDAALVLFALQSSKRSLCG